MKKNIACLLMAVCMFMVLTPVSAEAAESESNGRAGEKSVLTVATNDAKSVADTEDSNSHILVAYFSATGNTEPIAKYLAEALGADLYEILPEEEYTEADLDYGDSDSRTSIEQNDDNARPELADYSLDLSNYDTVLIGHPIWWGEAPKLIYTFLESYDFSGKTLTTFCTSASSGLGSSAENLKESVPDDVTWLESRRFAIGTKEDDVVEWLQEIGLK